MMRCVVLSAAPTSQTQRIRGNVRGTHYCHTGERINKKKGESEGWTASTSINLYYHYHD
jgi:Tfp pilus assembly protein PilE